MWNRGGLYDSAANEGVAVKGGGRKAHESSACSYLKESSPWPSASEIPQEVHLDTVTLLFYTTRSIKYTYRDTQTYKNKRIFSRTETKKIKTSKEETKKKKWRMMGG